jgi:putative heme-binding domain-containing protein
MATKCSLLFLLALIPAAAQEPDVTEGAFTFRVYCSECHGLKGRGGRGPDLAGGRFTHGDTDADLARVISKGVPGTGMPAFGEDLPDVAVRQLVAFVKSLHAGTGIVQITGNVERGRELFWGKGNCGSCHMVSGRGGRLGPELTRIGAQRSVAYLRESIVNPSADIAEGYQGVRIVPRGGQAITGIRKNEDNFTIQVFDTSENYHSFRKADLETFEELRDSLMPSSALTPAEVDDVVAYLDSLRGKP